MNKRYGLFRFVLIFMFLLMPLTQIQAQELLIDERGRMFMEWTGAVLGEETDRITTGNTSNSSENEDEDENELTDDQDDLHREEIRTGNNTFRKIEIEEDRLRVKIRREADDEDEATRPAQRVRTIRIREHSDTTDVVIESGDEGAVVSQGKTRVRTHFPISIGPENELIITTPTGSKVVAVLPDAAVKNLLQKGFPVVSSDAEFPPDEGTESGSLTEPTESETETEIELVEDEGNLVYKAKSKRKMKFLGLVEVEGESEAEISAETGQILSVNDPWYFRYFSYLFR